MKQPYHKLAVCNAPRSHSDRSYIDSTIRWISAAVFSIRSPSLKQLPNFLESTSQLSMEAVTFCVFVEKKEKRSADSFSAVLRVKLLLRRPTPDALDSSTGRYPGFGHRSRLKPS